MVALDKPVYCEMSEKVIAFLCEAILNSLSILCHSHGVPYIFVRQRDNKIITSKGGKVNCTSAIK